MNLNMMPLKHNNMLTITHPLTASNIWIEIVHNQVDSTLDNNVLTLNSSVGEGTVKYFTIQKELFITFIRLNLTAPIKMKRVAGNANDYFILNFFLSKQNVTQKANNKTQLLGLHHYSMLFSSAMTNAETIIPSQHPIDIFNITLSKQWIIDHVLDAENSAQDFFGNLLNQEGAVYLYENIDYKLSAVLQEILGQQETIGKIKLFANILTLLAHFFEKVSQRSINQPPAPINELDLKNLLTLIEETEADWKNIPSVETMAEKAHMSLSKFKRLFNQVFGKSPYQYFLALKMERAMELLETNEYSVSEVGYLVGYSNLGQFSKVFKRHHSLLPSEVK
ncbi:hypothetical protein BKI52_23610 [marine bacterium AO1-C]|nr:hypothetical protein BKI52_23610 [marine bacterium AO1-C]